MRCDPKANDIWLDYWQNRLSCYGWKHFDRIHKTLRRRNSSLNINITWHERNWATNTANYIKYVTNDWHKTLDYQGPGMIDKEDQEPKTELIS